MIVIPYARSETQVMVSDLETGRRKLGVDDIAPICAALSLTLHELAIGADHNEQIAFGLEPRPGSARRSSTLLWEKR